MDDYLSDKEQWELVKAWLRTNGAWIVGGIAIAALGIYGWRSWQDHVENQALEAAAKYESILQAFEKGDRSRALTLIGELGREHPKSPYNDQAQLTEARIYVQNGQLDKAAGNLQAVMDRTRDPQLSLTARLRLARVQLAQNQPDQALATLNAVKEPGAFAARFQEARGDIQLAKGDKAAALKEYQGARDSGSRGTVDDELLGLKINELTDEPKPEK